MTDNPNEKEGKGTGALTERARDPGFWKEIWLQFRLVLALLRDPEVPIYLKLLPAAAVLYVIFPLDFAPDIYPILGQLDDLTALLVGAKVFVEMAPQDVVYRHQQRLSEEAGRATVQQDDDELKDAIIIDVEHEMVEKKVEEIEP
jgi:uncharacterized membrane protein YkvA (DUF1232 family)